MGVPSLEFVLALLLLVIVFHSVPSRRFRRVLLTICNVGFLFFFLPNWQSWIAFVGFVLSGYAAGRVLQKRPGAGVLAGYLTILSVAFMVLKKYVLAGIVLPQWIMDHPISAVGLSYTLFRQIHFVVDVAQEQIESFTFWSYLNYQFNLFAFISGPIQRYQEFEPTWREMTPLLLNRYDIIRAYIRLFIGAVKVLVLSSFFFSYFTSQRVWFIDANALVGATHRQVLSRFLTLFYSYPLYLYFNFSGYCDVVIAAAALVGIKLPENFDRPYLARNVSDYWTRFHRSLGFWIRDYLFTPMYKAAVTRWSENATMLVFPCYLIAFILAGIWHGNTMNFFIFGLLHGIGICIGKLWENHLVKQRGRKGFKAYLANNYIRFAAVVVTLNFVAFTMLFFPNSVGAAMAILHNFAQHMVA